MSLALPEFAGLLVLGVGAGTLGALVGLGGGVVVVPVLILVFHLDVRVSVATSLLAVIATSVAAGSVHLGSGLANLRVGLRLELATAGGGIVGGLVATAVAPEALSFLLGVVLAATAVLLLRGRDSEEPLADSDDGPRGPDRPHQAVGRLAGSYRDGYSGVVRSYEAERVTAGSALAFAAGGLSGMLGVGGGFLKVPAMNLLMRLPLKVSTATSNFMVGITALASLFIYLSRGYFYPYLAAPVAGGVMLGALAGTRLQDRSAPRSLRRLLGAILALIAVQLSIDAFGG